MKLDKDWYSRCDPWDVAWMEEARVRALVALTDKTDPDWCLGIRLWAWTECQLKVLRYWRARWN